MLNKGQKDHQWDKPREKTTLMLCDCCVKVHKLQCEQKDGECALYIKQHLWTCLRKSLVHCTQQQSDDRHLKTTAKCSFCSQWKTALSYPMSMNLWCIYLKIILHPPACVIPKLDICCVLLLPPLAMCLKLHTWQHWASNRDPVGLKKVVTHF